MSAKEPRATELFAVVDQALAGATRVVLFRGVAGIGKTALLDAVAASLRARSRVLTVRCGEFGAASEFGVVRELFKSACDVAESGRSWEEIARRALVCLDSPKSLGGSTPLHDAYPALQELYRLTASMLVEQPLTLVVDDAELCDEPSMWFLDFLLRRVDRSPLLVLFGRRTGRVGPGADCLARIAADPRCTVLTIVDHGGRCASPRPGATRRAAQR